MVLQNLQHILLDGPLPDVRPSRAHPEHRAQRKRYEKESPHFSMSEFGIKAAVLAVLAALACIPWGEEEKKREGDEGKRERGKKEEREGHKGERRKSYADGKRRSADARAGDGGYEYDYGSGPYGYGYGYEDRDAYRGSDRRRRSG
jgi:hypothetical protein